MLIQFDKNDHGFYSVWFRYLELAFIVVNIPLISFCIFGIVRMHLHINLKMCIIPCFLYILLLHFIDRILINLHYFGVFAVPDKLENSQFLVFLSAVSIFSLTYVCIAMAAIFIERCLATYFVENYEKRKRKYIGYVSLSTFAAAMIITIPVFMEWIHWFFLGLVDCTCGCLAAMGSIFLYDRNKKNYKKLMSSPVTKGYTLSQRWQMDENLKTLKMIKNIVMLTGFCPAINSISFLVMMVSEEHQAFGRSLFYLSIAIECFTMVSVGVLSSPQIRASITRPFRRKSTVENVSDSTDRYFTQLMQQWETTGDNTLV